MLFNYLDISRKSKRSQSALEYMMTYGWAILIIVIVAVILYSMGIFNPSSSITTTITGFQSLGVTQAACINSVNNQILELYVTNNVGYPINLTKINVTGNNGVTVTQDIGSLLYPGHSSSFYVNGACNKSSSSYSGSVTITYMEVGQPLPGPYISTGKISKVVASSNLDLVGNFTNSSQIQTNSGYSAPTALTISMWVSLKDLDNSLGQYFEISGYDSKSQESTFCCNWRFGFETNGVFFDPGYWGDRSVSSSMSYNKWYLVSMVLENITGSNDLFWIYINNTLITNGVATSSEYGIPPVNYLDFGAGPGTGPAMNGKISDIQIYTTALSQNQISKLFMSGIGGAPLSNAGLVGWWPLDGNANDYSANNNNGVATNVNFVSP